jgi:hypothetical protein
LDSSCKETSQYRAENEKNKNMKGFFFFFFLGKGGGKAKEIKIIEKKIGTTNIKYKII